MTTPIGRSVRPLDWQDRSLGRVAYVNDLAGPPHLHAAVLRSPVPYGRITRLDVAPALRMPGVRETRTYAVLEEVKHSVQLPL